MDKFQENHVGAQWLEFPREFNSHQPHIWVICVDLCFWV